MARSRLAGFDPRLLHVLVALFVLVPALRPLGLPVEPTRATRDFNAALAAVPAGAVVLVGCDFDGTARTELEPMLRTALRRLWRRRCRVVLVSQWAGGAPVAEAAVTQVSTEMRARGLALTDGEDWVDLGYRAGGEAALLLLAQGLRHACPVDVHGRSTRSLPALQGVDDIRGVALVIELSAGAPGAQEWVRQVRSRYDVPIVAGVTAAEAPDVLPYAQTGQLRGLLAGMAGAAEFERAQGERGPASRGMEAQSLVHVLLAACLVAGGLAGASRRGGRP